MKNLPVPISSELLTSDVWANLLAINPQLAKAYATNQLFRTETEARISVLNDLHFPTRAAKYWQSVREQCVMLEQLALLSFEWRRNELQIRKLSVEPDEAAQIDLDEAMWKRGNLERVAADRAREIHMWEKLKLEQVKADPTFDRDNVDTHQLISYTTQFAKRASHADAAKMTGGELDNLVGQLTTAVARCRDNGLLEQVLKGLPVEIARQLSE